jgi:superfamily II DNA or RNA helicase
MKAVLSDRIYLKVTEEQRQELIRVLTYSIPQFGNGKRKNLVIRNCTIIKPDVVSIPSGREDLIPEGAELVDKRQQIPVVFPKFKFTLRESQQKIYDAVDSSCIINAAPSWGKTFSGIAIAAKLGLKTLVVVHTLALRMQWEKEIKHTLGIEAGVIGSGKFDTDSIIVVANIQTLTKNMHKVANMFGTLIIDECHHTPASTFTKVVNISKAKYKIGLSGTVERKDGMHVILADYFSKTMYRPPRENMMMPTIYRIPTDIQFSDNAEVPWAHRVNDLFKQAEFFNLVVSTAAVQASRGHKVLVVSDRVQFLENCHEILSDNSICISGSIKSLEERERLIESIYSTHDIIFGTTSIFSEGISINPLSCLILTSPISNDSLLEQLIGRIVRVVPGKKTPEVLDFLLQGATAKRQATKRLGLYIKRGYKISELQQTKNKFDK